MSSSLDPSLLRVLELSRALHRAVDVARLERTRRVFRASIAGAFGVEGGFSLTRDELECVLEYPPAAHVDFLMTAFRTTAPSETRGERIDLLTLLAACTCLARGALEAKARFLFSLVDFDVEDEIVEDELAMVIALCSDGLRRLGIVATELSDVDARALACEAFDFVEIDDGGKMNLAQFVRWLVSHWRPAALFDRIQTLFLISTVVDQLQNSLHRLELEKSSGVQPKPNVDPVPCELGRRTLRPLLKPTSVKVGPIVGRVTTTTAVVSFECDAPGVTTMTLTDCMTSEAFSTRAQTSRNRPVTCIVRGLTPGRLYNVSIMDEARVDGLVQTPPVEPAGIRILILAEDAFCSQSVHNRRAYVSSHQTSLMNEILDHFANGSSKHGCTMMFDMTVRLGSMAALQHDLLGGYELMREELHRNGAASRCLEDLVRNCYRTSTSSPDNRALLSRGAHYFAKIGLIRGLLKNGAPLPLLEITAKVAREYEQIDVLPHQTSLPFRVSEGIDAVMLDTTDCLFAQNDTSFVNWPEQLLTSKQISVIASVVAGSDKSISRSGSSQSRQILIFCDAPFVWPFAVKTPPNASAVVDKVGKVAADPWRHYPADLQLFLGMVFDAIHENPLLRITLICCGPIATRVVITNKASGRSIDQLTVGTVSNIDRQPPQVAYYFPDPALAALGRAFTLRGQPLGGTDLALKQYCILDIVPHPRGSVCNHSVYTAGRPDAKIILGPVVGRVATRAARILIEVDRAVEKISCVLSSSTAAHSVSVESNVEAFAPTILKVEGLHPGTRYNVKFEGVIPSEGPVYIETPSQTAISVEWLVFSQNNLRSFIASGSRQSEDDSSWPRILAPCTRSSVAQLASKVASLNEDSLGDSKDVQSESYNPWYHVEAHALSEPLRKTQLSIHIGGQVDLSTAFPDSELSFLVGQLCALTASNEVKRETYKSIRFRLQEVYRKAWGVEPMRTILASTSNVMLLHEDTDLFFSTSRLQALLYRCAIRIDEDQVARVAFELRALAFELWQLYQNQLVADVNESDLDNSRRNSSKFASHTTFGMCRLLFLNVSDELRDASSNENHEKQPFHSTQSLERVAPLTLPKTSTDSQLPLLSSATWRTIDEALDVLQSDAKEGKIPTTRSKIKSGASIIKQLVVFIPVDLLQIVAGHPSVRTEVTHLLEKLFEWKAVARSERRVHLITNSEQSSSLTFTVIDEKNNEDLTMTRISSISRPTLLQLTKRQTKPNAGGPHPVSTIKGHFSKRFTYESIPVPASGGVSHDLPCRSYAKYSFLCDYRRGFLSENLQYFPSRALCKIVVGPIIGRFVREMPEVSDSSDRSSQSIPINTFGVPILVETNASARLTCVVVDSMLNSETRVTGEPQGEMPYVFFIHGLIPLRRYVYFFEGVSNSEERRGCFHTPSPNGSNLNLVVVSSNFPTHMDEEQDSLWLPLLNRAKVPWCGIDAVLHLGGQVPLHEAAVECLEWVKQQLSREVLHGDPTEIDRKRLEYVRSRVRRRFQQEYYICWNLPNIRELLACASHWFLPSKTDIAPFFGKEARVSSDESRAVDITLQVAKEVVLSYQIQLVTGSKFQAASCLDPPVSTNDTSEDVSVSSVNVNAAGAEGAQSDKPSIETEANPASSSPPSVLATVGDDPGVEEPSVDRHDMSSADNGGAIYWQHDDIAVFLGDMRAVSSASDTTLDEPITCNGRLTRPLSREENAVMSEKQWLFLESALRKKRTQLFILCFELPLILTNSEHVEKLRDEIRRNHANSTSWKTYDHNHVLQHWVACKRQLEQLLLLLFKWKAKRSGRDVLVLSGGMRVAVDTMVQDRETKLSLRNLTVGPVTANVETFEFPLSGVACATFAGGVKDDHFTFRHSLLMKKNYLLLQVSVDQLKEARSPGQMEGKTTSVVADFVPNEPAAVQRLHPDKKFCRHPAWWTSYVPMGKFVFWDDTITLKSETDERMLALREFLWHDRGISGVLEVLYEKYEFAETARMEDLRSRHLQHVDFKANFRNVLAELWRAIPDTKRKQMAYFLDPFVREMLMSNVAPDLFAHKLQTGEPIELAFFCRVIREFVFAASLLRLTITTQQEDEIRAHEAAIEKQKRDAEQAALDKERQEKEAREEADRMAELLRTDPLAYAKIKVAQEEAEKLEKQRRHEEKLAHKRAERLAELAEEQAIAKEQKKLNLLAERDAGEYERRQRALDARIRQLEEKRAQRAAAKAEREAAKRMEGGGLSIDKKRK